MPAEDGFVIIGASLAGAKAAETLREEGFAGPVTLVGEEHHRPYERPPLSKGFLIGKDEAESAYVHAAGWYAEHDVELRTGVRAEAVDRAAKVVRLAGGETVPYARLLLATGASPRRLPVPGTDLDGVHYLRTLPDSERLRAALRGGGRVVIAGGGWIGLETAAAARGYGCEVTIAEPDRAPLYRSVGAEIGEVFAGLHRAHGVTFRLGEGVAELRGDGGGVRSVVTTSGAELPADIVIIGIGAVPNDGLAAAAGLQTGNGVLTDAALRTSDPDIFAAGDAARFEHPLLGRRIRVEHWANALTGGPVAARAMLGQPVTHDNVPYFYSDQYDLGMEAAGVPEPGNYDQLVYRGDPRSLEFVAFWLSGGAVVAGMNVNVWDVNEAIQQLIASGRQVDAGRLADPGVPLAEL